MSKTNFGKLFKIGVQHLAFWYQFDHYLNKKICQKEKQNIILENVLAKMNDKNTEINLYHSTKTHWRNP